ncbi:hypothetical protein SAMN02745163_01414 [Clostridium cavendishii DSM 21758]|uniref:Uncharacterized protein n=1 Tax=Clostridium cavendishii DSM 21758 TaxID=1121302 RepID=A0A1M6GWW8_9CLOT|nr:hypothetical protein [Clostridium cavendishii]SHJ14432.1 hypothetical protein SAMN02745163_01414 [Clostridium cavendishii DSM 21758]
MTSFFKDKYERFWSWFYENEDRLFNFEKHQEELFDELSYELEEIDPNLTFEISCIKENGKRELVISAGGIKSAFDEVENLVDVAPKLRSWEFIKYRPRRDTLSELDFQGKKVKPEDVYYAIFYEDNPSKVGIILFFKEYKEEELDLWGQITYLFLDEALGEYDVETKVGGIMATSINSKYFKHAHPINELQKAFDSCF